MLINHSTFFNSSLAPQLGQCKPVPCSFAISLGEANNCHIGTFKAGKKYRNHVLTFSECLKEAWKDERSSYDKAMKMYQLFNLNKKQCESQDAKRNVGTCSMAFMANTLTNYYANNRYNGD